MFCSSKLKRKKKKKTKSPKFENEAIETVSAKGGNSGTGSIGIFENEVEGNSDILLAS